MTSNDELAALIAQLDEGQVERVRAYIRSLLHPIKPVNDSLWSFDFIEQFNQAKVSAQRDKSGMEVRVADAICEQVIKPAIWEHPPLSGAAVISYAIPIPPHLPALKLKFFTGVRDGSQLPNDRFVAFRVIVNGWKLWSAVKNTRAWEEYTVAMPELGSDVARIDFQTDGMGNHQWNWAVWGEPRLIADL